MIIIGCDPGKTGCLAAIDSASGNLLAFLHMPTVKLGSKNRVNPAALAAWLQSIVDMGDTVKAVIELVGSRPGEGSAGAFSFGHSTGSLEGVVAALGIPYVLTTPQVWKRAAGLDGQEKDAARARCASLYPGVRDLDLIAKGQALADAIMIAKHGGAKLGGV